MALVYPLIAWGSAEDISASPWIDIDTPIVTGSQADPFGGTSAYLVNDNNGSGTEARALPFVPTLSTPSVVAVFVKEGTSSANTIRWRDSTAGVWRHTVAITWAGGVPTLSTGGGSGTLLTPISVGSGFYLIIFTVDAVVASNSHLLYIYPTNLTGSSQGTATFYVRNVVALPPLDQVVASDDPRAGYEMVQNPSGVEDAWVVGTDYRLEADIRFVSKLPVDSPLTYSGWDGLNEVSGVNAGVAAMLRAGRDKSDLIYVPDRSDCSTFITSKLDQPLQGGVALEEDGTRRIRIVLRNSSTEYEGYA